MALGQLPGFNFFDKSDIFDNDAPQNLSNEPHLALQALNVSCADSGHGHIVFGDTEGRICLADRDFRLNLFQAYRVRTTLIAQMKGSDILVSVGDGIDPRPIDVQAEGTKRASHVRQRLREMHENLSNNNKVTEEGTTAEDLERAYGFILAGDETLTSSQIGQSVACLKIWNVDKLDDATGAPSCLRTIRIFEGSGHKDSMPEQAVTCLAVARDLSQIALGLNDGRIMIFIGDFERDRGSIHRIIVRPPSKTGNTSSSAVNLAPTFLEYTEWEDPRTLTSNHGPQKVPVLYAVSRQSVHSCFIPPKATSVHDVWVNSLDDVAGSERNCCAVTPTGLLVKGVPDGLYYYTPEDRRNATAFTGEKDLITCFRSYVIVAAHDSYDRHNVSIIDVQNKISAYSFPLESVTPFTGGQPERYFRKIPQTVQFIFAEWGAVFIYTSAGVVYQLVEKDTQTKLEYLFSVGMFDVALSLARNNQYDDKNIGEIHRMYGDHLYDAGEFDQAIREYVHTIGYVEPSYVVRRFLDAPRIQNLRTYLEALHTAGMATGDHTTLLISCYTKLRDTRKLRQFLRGGHGGQSDESKEKHPARPNFDVDTAINVLRTSKYLDDALYLAGAHEKIESYVEICIEDLGSDLSSGDEDFNFADDENPSTISGIAAHITSGFDAALAFLYRLPFYNTESLLERFGHILLAERPGATTALFQLICTHFEPLDAASGRSLLGNHVKFPSDSTSKEQVTEFGSPSTAVQRRARRSRADVSKFISLYAEHPAYLKVLLQYVVAHRENDGKDRVKVSVWNTLLELCLREDVSPPRVMNPVRQDVAAYMAVRDEYITKMDSSITQKGTNSQINHPTSAYPSSNMNTDFNSANFNPDEASLTYEDLVEQRNAEVLEAILKNFKARYDDEHGLMLVQQYRYDEGMLYMYEKLGLYDLLLNHRITLARKAATTGRFEDVSQARKDVIVTCEIHGHAQPNLYVTALQFFAESYTGDTSDPDLAAEEAQCITDVLDQIEETHILEPMQVLEIISKNPKAPFSLVRKYVLRQLKHEERTIENDKRVVETLQDETRTLRQHVKHYRKHAEALRKGGKEALRELRAKQRSADGARSTRLGLPNLAYVSTSLTPDEENQREQRAQWMSKADNHGHFFAALADAPDGFDVVAEYFKRGLFEPEALEISTQNAQVRKEQNTTRSDGKRRVRR